MPWSRRFPELCFWYSVALCVKTIVMHKIKFLSCHSLARLSQNLEFFLRILMRISTGWILSPFENVWDWKYFKFQICLYANEVSQRRTKPKHELIFISYTHYTFKLKVVLYSILNNFVWGTVCCEISYFSLDRIFYSPSRPQTHEPPASASPLLGLHPARWIFTAVSGWHSEVSDCGTW